MSQRFGAVNGLQRDSPNVMTANHTLSLILAGSFQLSYPEREGDRIPRPPKDELEDQREAWLRNDHQPYSIRSTPLLPLGGGLSLATT